MPRLERSALLVALLLSGPIASLAAQRSAPAPALSHRPLRGEPTELVFSGYQTFPGQERVWLVRNASPITLPVLQVQLAGPHAADYDLLSAPTLLPPWAVVPVRVRFAPQLASLGERQATLALSTPSGTAAVDLYGLSAFGPGGPEPRLQSILDVLGHAVDAGGPGLLPTSPEAIGDELFVPLFRRAGPGPVELRPLARYSPAFELPFGCYLPGGAFPVHVELGRLRGGPDPLDSQTLHPPTTAGPHPFDPGMEAFGVYGVLPTHTTYTEDDLNALLHPTHLPHAARIYPARDRAGQPILDAWIVAFEESTNGDYQDYVFLLTNAAPAG